MSDAGIDTSGTARCLLAMEVMTGGLDDGHLGAHEPDTESVAGDIQQRRQLRLRSANTAATPSAVVGSYATSAADSPRNANARASQSRWGHNCCCGRFRFELP